MARILFLIAALALAFSAWAECSGSTCVGHKSKFEAVPTVRVQP